MSWNRKYRPRAVQDLHLDFVRTQISRMMEAGKIPQALLFAGPKGTGKTSTSRILGAVVNDPKNEKQVDAVYFQGKKPNKPLSEPTLETNFSDNIFAGTSFIVQEMDAASNRGIDNIRELKTRAFLPPQEGKMSVFILDEAHMLTTEAFNALLKLLEEPPEHVIFILATTELHKIPETIVSRCQLVEFKKATLHEITNRLKSILIEEKIDFEEPALELIATASDGSFRDAIKLLELTAQSGKITVKEVEVYVSHTSTQEVQKLIKHLLNKDEKSVSILFEALREKAVDPKFFHKAVLDFLHLSLLQDLGVKAGESFINKKISQFLLQELSSSELTTQSPIPHLLLELKVLELIDRSNSKSGERKSKQPKSTVKKQSHSKQNLQESISSYESAFTSELNNFQAEKIETSQFSESENKHSNTDYSFTGDSSLLQTNWETIIEVLTESNSTLSALLRSAKLLNFADHSATIGVYYSFHKEQLSQPKSIAAIQEAIKQVIGGYININFVLEKTPEKAELVDAKNSDPLVASATQALL